MSKTIARAAAGLAEAATAWMKPYRRAITRALVAERLTQTCEVATPAGPLRFQCASARALHDPLRLYEGEPETIAWIDALPAGEVLWDIGANIGVYALYAARVRGLKVVAFEPGAASYAALVRNIEINRLAGVDAYCLAFDAETRLDYLNMANTAAGHSMHAFGQEESVEGRIATVFRQSVPGFSIDDFCRLFRVAPPDHVKLDVDSIEERILEGGRRTLMGVKSLLVEIDGTTRAAGASGIRGLLRELGFAEAPSPVASPRRNVLFRRLAAPAETEKN